MLHLLRNQSSFFSREGPFNLMSLHLAPLIFAIAMVRCLSVTLRVAPASRTGQAAEGQRLTEPGLERHEIVILGTRGPSSACRVSLRRWWNPVMTHQRLLLGGSDARSSRTSAAKKGILSRLWKNSG